MCERSADVGKLETVTTGHVMSMDELANVRGRGWEDIDVSSAHRNAPCFSLSKSRQGKECVGDRNPGLLTLFV